MSEHEPPELSNLDTGGDVKVYYQSSRSGNEVSRKGTVSFTTEVEGTVFHWIHTEKKEPLKHQYITLCERETEDGRTVVLAISATVSAEEPNDGEPPKPGSAFPITFTVARKSHLGLVDRVMENGVNINVEL